MIISEKINDSGYDHEYPHDIEYRVSELKDVTEIKKKHSVADVFVIYDNKENNYYIHVTYQEGQ